VPAYRIAAGTAFTRLQIAFLELLRYPCGRSPASNCKISLNFQLRNHEMKLAFAFLRIFPLMGIKVIAYSDPNRTDRVDYPNKRTLR